MCEWLQFKSEIIIPAIKWDSLSKGKGFVKYCAQLGVTTNICELIIITTMFVNGGTAKGDDII